MDQDAFRQLLSTPRNASSSSAGPSRRILLPTKDKKSSDTIPAYQNAFKPRKVNKKKTAEPQDSRYRDRAAERRQGANEYAEIEGILEDFEQKNASDEVVVKGLDFTLLEQNKARSSENQSADFDEALEDAYKSASSSTQPPPAKTSTSSAKKRTREDLIRELKESREKGAGAPKAEGAVASKFKPIGAPKANEEVKKKKKRKIVATESSKVTSDSATMAPPPLPQSSKLSLQRKPKPLVEEEPPDDSFDIFADAGEYEGLDVDSDEESTAPKKEGEELEATLSKTNWFGEQSATEDDTPFKPPPPMPTKQQSRSPSPQPTRLVPLSSSALPSISEFLAMDAEVEKAEKRKARKEKAKLKAEGKKTKGDESD